MVERDNIRFNVLRNALYHSSRRRHFERLSRSFTFTTVMLGTAAASNGLLRIGISGAEIGVVVAAIGALQLVFDFGRSARDHQALQRDYYALLADIEERSEATDTDCAAWQARMIRITGDEPPTLRAVDAKAYNDAIDATDTFDATERLRIPTLHRMLGWLLPFDGYSYRKLSEDV
jgi:hypothetical protein